MEKKNLQCYPLKNTLFCVYATLLFISTFSSSIPIPPLSHFSFPLAAFEDMLENPLNSTQWMNDPETGPVMLQISRIFQTLNRT